MVGAYSSSAIVEIVDDYLEDPDSARQFALESEFVSPFTGTWNGLHSTRAPQYSHDVFHDIAARIDPARISNYKDLKSSEDFWGAPSIGVFALLPGGKSDTIHFHRRTGSWAGVLYLSKLTDSETRFGVSFYKHRKYGIDVFDEASHAEIAEELKGDGGDADKWEHIQTVKIKFNRMVIFNGKHFHSAGPGFGHRPESMRLAQLFSMELE
jgi:Family of unknown function (DUF6445)